MDQMYFMHVGMFRVEDWKVCRPVVGMMQVE